MQDKGQPGGKAQLVDQAWADMQQRLDEVMPVQRKRRWVIFLWLLPLALLGAWGYGQYASGNTEIEDIEQVAPDQAVSSPVAVTPAASERLNEHVEVEEERPAAARQAEHPLRTTKDAATVPTDKKPSSVRSDATVLKSTPFEGAPSNIVTDLEEKALLAESRTTVSAASIPTKEEEPFLVGTTTGAEQLNASRAVTEATSSASNSTLSLLPTLAFWPEQTGSTAALTAVGSPISTRIISPFRFFAQAHLGHELAHPRGFWGFGGGVQRSIGRRGLWEASLFYEKSYFSSTQDEQGLLAVTVPNSAATFGSDTEAYAIDGEGSPNFTFNRLQLQLSYVYQLSPKWSVGGGLLGTYYQSGEIATAMNLSQEVDNTLSDMAENATTLDVYSNEFTFTSFDAARNSYNPPITLTATRWQLAGAIQVEYLLGKKYGLQGQLRRDLSAWPKQEFANSRTTSFSLGFKYYLSH